MTHSSFQIQFEMSFGAFEFVQFEGGKGTNYVQLNFLYYDNFLAKPGLILA